MWEYGNGTVEQIKVYLLTITLKDGMYTLSGFWTVHVLF
jgi:hypothetical protein